MRGADPAVTPALHVVPRLRGPPTNSSSTPSNGADSRGRLAAVTGVAGAAGENGTAPLIIIGSTAHTLVRLVPAVWSLSCVHMAFGMALATQLLFLRPQAQRACACLVVFEPPSLTSFACTLFPRVPAPLSPPIRCRCCCCAD